MRRLARLLVASLALATATAATAAPPTPPAHERLLAGPDKGTYLAIAEDIARLAAPAANLALAAVSTRGSSDNVQRLHADAETSLALVQSDVYQAFLDEAADGNAAAAERVAHLRVLLALYSEELYLVVRADSPMRQFEDIRDQRINIGPPGSGTALSTTTVYRRLFGQGVPARQVTQFDNADALRRLVEDRSVDVVAMIAGQPTPMFAAMKPEARRYIRLLRFEPRASTPPALLATYGTSTIHAASYPAWLDADVPTLSTRALLVARQDRPAAERDRVARLASALCTALPRLQAEGHPKWREVSAGRQAVGQGWRWHDATDRRPARCTTPPDTHR